MNKLGNFAQILTILLRCGAAEDCVDSLLNKIHLFADHGEGRDG
jgi:hypothetical protein